MQLNQAIERALRATEHSGRWHCVFRPDMLELRYIVARQDDLWTVRGALVANNAWARSERLPLALEDFAASDWQMEMCDEGIQAGTRDCPAVHGQRNAGQRQRDGQDGADPHHAGLAAGTGSAGEPAAVKPMRNTERAG